MKQTFARPTFAAVALAASLVATGAHAIDFEDVAPSLYAGGDSFATGGYLATVGSAAADVGLSGAIADGSDPTGCFVLDCPAGNASHFFLGVNDGSVAFTRPDVPGGFTATSFLASFVAPVAGTPIPDTVARLRVFGTVAGTGSLLETSFDLPGQTSGGSFAFTSFNFAGTAFSGVSLSSIGFYACLIDGGRCDYPADDQAQFALDDVVLTTPVPEPSTAALLAVGGLLMGRWARRRASTAA